MYEYPEGYSGTFSTKQYTKDKNADSYQPHSHYDTSQSRTDHKLNRIALLHLEDESLGPPKRMFNEDRYRLLHSIELSDSSDDEVVTYVEHSSLNVATALSMSRWNDSDHESSSNLASAVDVAGQASQPQHEMEFFDDEFQSCSKKGEVPPLPGQAGASQMLLDHSVNPLHELNILQLRQLSQSLQKKVLSK